MAGIDAFTLRREHTDEGLHALQRLSRVAALAPPEHLDGHVAYELSRHGATALRLAEQLLVDELTARITRTWEQGWQPRDVLHVAGKLNARSVEGLRRLVLHQARSSNAESRAPRDWRDQLDAVRAEVGEVPRPWLPIRQSPDPVWGWAAHLVVIKLLAELAPLECIAPPPSQWGREARQTSSGSPPTSDRDRVLQRIRGLLAKAESTEHAAEAEVFSAKAQELMTKHAVDEALLSLGRHDTVDVLTRRFPIQAPYVAEKSMLLAAVARANRCRVVRLAPYDLCAVVGTAVDVDQVELLFTSLLIQATRAMAEAGRGARSFDRSKSFRRSFLAAYATRIGERLTEADRATTAAYGAELVPVLQRQADAVEAEFLRLFPRTVGSGTRYFDPRGWEAGQAAADRARFAAGRIGA